MRSLTEENYLKCIYKVLEKSKIVHTNQIAYKMNTKAASVTDMLSKLSAKKLVNYKKYQGVTLTAEGTKVALLIIRKHRLWEMFLVEKLGFKWDEVHDIAEQLEHINSDKLIEQVDKALNFPKIDPHGDPIPDANGKIVKENSISLSLLSIDKTARIISVIDHSPSFLQFLDKSHLKPGSQIKINLINEVDGSMSIRVNNKNQLIIGHETAAKIMVKVV